VVFNGNLWVFHQGLQNNGQLWYSVWENPGPWSADQQLNFVVMSGSPSVVVYRNDLWVFHNGGDGSLWYSVFDAGRWLPDERVNTVALTGSPSAVVFRDRLYVFHQGSGGDPSLWYSVWDGANWAQDEPLNKAGLSTSAAPAPTQTTAGLPSFSAWTFS
jgi:hypothetical protein